MLGKERRSNRVGHSFEADFLKRKWASMDLPFRRGNLDRNRGKGLEEEKWKGVNGIDVRRVRI